MIKFFRAIFISSRPRQWIKNAALFVGIVFGGRLFDVSVFQSTFLGFCAFCLISASHYLLNDVIDAHSDRAHPYKKYRPIALRQLSEPTAIVVACIFVISGFWISRSLSFSFFMIAVVFAAFQYLYALVLKKIPVIDVLTIVVGYVLRVYAGEIASGVRVHSWLMVTTVMGALLLGIGKRRAERTLIEQQTKTTSKVIVQQSALYADKLLDTYMAMAATATFLTYTFYTFFSKIPGSGLIPRDVFESFLDVPDRKWMMATVPFVLFGIMRYMQLVYEKHTQVMEKIITSDIPLLITGGLWATTLLIVVYGLGK